MEQEGLYFRMFGRFAAVYNGRELKLDKSGATKVIQLLSMLVYFRKGISREQLLRNLYGEKELADLNNNLRVTVFKLRKILYAAGLPREEYIVVQDGTYFWKSSIPTRCDVWEFQEAVQRAGEAETRGESEKELALRRMACGLYTDELLQKLSSEEWVLMEAVPLKNTYSRCLKRLCSLLAERGEYAETVALCAAAERIYPYDEWQLTRMDALMAMEQYDEAMAVYQEVTQRYFEDLGLSPTEEMLRRYDSLALRLKNRNSSLDEIYRRLEEPPSMGASLVSYMSFIDRFRFLQRISERSGESNYLVSVTVYSRKSGQPFDLDTGGGWADALMRRVLQQCLRRTDTYARSQEAQYLMLLVGISLEAVPIVMKRIDQALAQTASGKRLYCRYQSLPVKQPEEAEVPEWSFQVL